jgi:hypothetical protein
MADLAATVLAKTLVLLVESLTMRLLRTLFLTVYGSNRLSGGALA